MTEDKSFQVTNEDVKSIAKVLLEEIKKEKILKSSQKDSYEKTEYLLYKYSQLPDVINFLREEVKKLEEENKKLSPAKTKSQRIFLKEGEKTSSYIHGDEILDSRISELKQLIIKTRSYERTVDKSLKLIKEDEYYPIIEWIYFKKKTYDDISNEFGWAYGTISKHKSRLINTIKVYIFPNTFFNELGG